MLTSVRSYIPHPNKNYGVNSIKLILGEWTLWFSYSTCIAFQKDGGKIYMDSTKYSRTTQLQKYAIEREHGVQDIILVPREEFRDRMAYMITGKNN